MGSNKLIEACKAALATREKAQLLRQRRTHEAAGPVELIRAGRRLVNFASNNYLGLTHHPKVVEAAAQAARQAGAGAGAAGLITGHSAWHERAESAVANWKGTQAAVLLPSGWQAAQAAVGALSALGNVRFLLDKLAHASLLDAARATGAPCRVFGHTRMGKLERLLADAPAGQLQVVLTESIFSMDGDAADLASIAALKLRFDFALVLDEAHASGVYGAAGAGYATEAGFAGLADVTLATLSKAAGTMGGAVCGDADLCSAVVNFGRASLFSTALAPPVAAAAVAAIEVMRDEPWRQSRVRALALRVREALRALPFSTLATGDGQRDDGRAQSDARAAGGESAAPERPGASHAPADSPIIPVVLGSAERALAASRRLEEVFGLVAPAVRPPTVAPNTSRLRITLSAAHSDEQVDLLIRALRAIA